MVNIMFDNGYSLSIPGGKVRLFEGEKTSHIEIQCPDGDFYHINYKKILFVETLDDKQEESPSLPLQIEKARFKS